VKTNKNNWPVHSVKTLITLATNKSKILVMLNHSFLSKALDKQGADYRWEVKEWSSQKVQWFCWLRCDSLIFQKALSAHSMVNSNGWLQQEAPFA